MSTDPIPQTTVPNNVPALEVKPRRKVPPDATASQVGQFFIAKWRWLAASGILTVAGLITGYFFNERSINHQNAADVASIRGDMNTQAAALDKQLGDVNQHLKENTDKQDDTTTKVATVAAQMEGMGKRLDDTVRLLQFVSDRVSRQAAIPRKPSDFATYEPPAPGRSDE